MLNQVVVVGRIEQMREVSPEKTKLVLRVMGHRDTVDFITAYISNNTVESAGLSGIGALVGIKGKMTCRSMNAPLSIDVERLTSLASSGNSSTSE